MVERKLGLVSVPPSLTSGPGALQLSERKYNKA